MTDSANWASAAVEIEQLAAEELKMYRQLHGLMTRQREAVDREDTEQLMKVVGVKQSVLERIGAIQKAVGPVKTQWADHADQFEQGVRERIETTFRQTGELIKSILEIEDETQRRLATRRDGMMGQIKTIDRSRQASKAYGFAAPPAKGSIEREG